MDVKHGHAVTCEDMESGSATTLKIIPPTMHQLGPTWYFCCASVVSPHQQPICIVTLGTFGSARFHQQNLWNRVNHQKVQTPNSTWTMRIPDSVPNATWEGGAVCGALASLVQETRPFGKKKEKTKKFKKTTLFPHTSIFYFQHLNHLPTKYLFSTREKWAALLNSILNCQYLPWTTAVTEDCT